MGKKGYNILLVEDNPGHAKLAMLGLSEAVKTCCIHHSKNGEEAVAYLQDKKMISDESVKPDIILLDLRMPRMDGFEVLREIKNDESLMTIPVIVLTTSESENDRKTALELKADDYLVKSTDYCVFRDSLKKKVERWGGRAV
jgi:two-component system, chemotaxis family, response regulator Rcp1